VGGPAADQHLWQAEQPPGRAQGQARVEKGAVQHLPPLPPSYTFPFSHTTQKDKQALEDASNEIMLADDEDASSVMCVLLPVLRRGGRSCFSTPRCRFAVGDSYVQLDKDSIENKLQEYGSEIDKEIGALNTELASIQEQMGQLKATLYAKFKNNINLESDD